MRKHVGRQVLRVQRRRVAEDPTVWLGLGVPRAGPPLGPTPPLPSRPSQARSVGKQPVFVSTTEQ